jgi:Flp pilus assembly protein TadG
MKTSHGVRRQSGQMLVLFALALVVIVAGVGMVIDVGYAWSEQRHDQNASDAAARAGAVVLAREAAEGSTTTLTSAQWDEAVRNAVSVSATANGATVLSATYTDYLGNALTGSPAVGGGSVPAGAAGVNAATGRTPGTFFVRVVGINQWNIATEATAVSGPSTGCLETTDRCVFMPVTFPVTVFACTNNGKTQPIDPPQSWAFGVELTLPLCGGNPGSVGWIDWTPPNGGVAEEVGFVQNPPNISIDLPSWHYITQTGGISSSQLEDAINAYAGQIIWVPMFDSTCNAKPTDPQLSGCLAVNVGVAGVNQWYHISKLLAFRLDSPKGAFINGNNSVDCAAAANATQCLRGSFVQGVTEGTVGPPCAGGDCPKGTTFSVQLVR